MTVGVPFVYVCHVCDVCGSTEVERSLQITNYVREQ